MTAGFRHGLHRVHGGFSLDVGHAHLIVSIRPEHSPASWSRVRDYSGFRTFRLGRLMILHAWR